MQHLRSIRLTPVLMASVCRQQVHRAASAVSPRPVVSSRHRPCRRGPSGSCPSGTAVGIRLVAHFNLLAAFLVIFRVQLRFLHHTIDFVL